ncbi:MAG TPA: cation:proton antiporter family protein [Candidatus Nanopelagicales bacterium]|nr:cation:proton antiporter family protein [Candidatus Nanopelagicales bacterium]
MPPLPDIALTEELRFILNLGVAVLAALLGGAIATRLRQPTIVGYLVAGIAIGPFTPGFVGDQEQITVLADIGVVLLLFALGAQFPLRDLVAVRGVAVGAALLQVAATTIAGAVAAAVLGFDLRSAVVIGVTLAISSTLVVVKVLVERGELEAIHGRALVGWMIVQDLVTIVVAAALPALAGGDPVGPLLLAGGRVALFLGLAYLVGTRLLPAAFRLVARLGSSELFLLAVVATALVAAVTSSAAFGLGLALGAFVAGLLIAESELSYQAVAEIVPFRDLFAVLFFVSVGMLVDPASIAAQVGLVLVFVTVAAGLKGLLAGVFAHLFGLPARSAILLGATLAQVGEFSFILAEEALGLGILAKPAYDVLLGTAVVSIILTPFAVRGADGLVARMEAGQIAAGGAGGAGDAGAADPVGGRGGGHGARAAYASDGRPHVVVLGAGRVGLLVTRAVRTRGFGCVVVDRDQRRLDEAARLGAQVVYGDAASPAILERVGLAEARLLVVALADPLAARLAGERALIINPRLAIAARARGARDRATLRGVGVRRVADPEVEAGVELARHALQRMGVSGPELAAIASGLRRSQYGPEPAPGGGGTGAPE